MTVKAAVCHAFGEPLVVEEIEIAAPGRGELGIDVAACAICQSDIHLAKGAWGGELPPSTATRRPESSRRSGPTSRGSRSAITSS